jgi:hypothetical protein
MTDERIREIQEVEWRASESGNNMEALAIQDCLAEIMRLRGLMEWKPIETAKKDNSEVLGWSVDERYLMSFWDYDFSDRPYKINPINKYTGWLSESRIVNPTHWSPLPEPPIQQTNGEQK